LVDGKKQPKLIDKLGPKWTDEELQTFFDEFRQSESNWKKIASCLPGRSPSQCEELYNMHKTLLTLQNITAVVLQGAMQDVYINQAKEWEQSDHSQQTSGATEKGDASNAAGASSRKRRAHLEGRGSEAETRKKGLAGAASRPKAVRSARGGNRVSLSASEEGAAKPSASNRSALKAGRVGAASAATRTPSGARSIGTAEARTTPQSSRAVGKRTPRLNPGRAEASVARAAHALTSLPADPDDLGTPSRGHRKRSRQLFHDPTSPTIDDDATESVAALLALMASPPPSTCKAPRAKAEHAVRTGPAASDAEEDPHPTMSSTSTTTDNAPSEVTPTKSQTSRRSRKPARERAPKPPGRGVKRARGSMVEDSQSDVDDFGFNSRSNLNHFNNLINSNSNLNSNKRVSFGLSSSTAQASSKPAPCSSHAGISQRDLSVDQSDAAEVDERRLSSVSVTTPGHHPAGAVDVSASRPNVEMSLPAKLRKKKSKYGAAGEEAARAEVEMDSSPELPRPTRLAQTPQERLRNALLSPKLRRWCQFEWFYSAIDRPWFAQNEFMEYLDHLGMSQVTRLTRAEWCMIRASLGRPRRLSLPFLREERQKLENYRKEARLWYQKPGDLPDTFPGPLLVGQSVVAVHPKTRQMHDGQVLTVDRDKARVQFHCVQLGSELVADTEVMPRDPLDNLPESKKRVLKDLGVQSELAVQHSLVRKLHQVFADDASPDGTALGPMATIAEEAEPGRAWGMGAHALATSSGVELQQEEAACLNEYACSLERKEVLVKQLREMNNLAETSKSAVSEQFRDQYAKVVIDLRNANLAVDTCRAHLLEWQARGSSKTSIVATSAHAGLNDPTAQARVVQGAVHTARRCAAMLLEASQLEITQDASPAGADDEDLKMHGNDDHAGDSPGREGAFLRALSESQLDDARGSSQHPTSVCQLMVSCVAMLFLVQGCCDMGSHDPSMIQCLDQMMSSLQPRFGRNVHFVKDMERSVASIKELCMRS